MTTVRDYEKKIIKLNRRIGQLKRHNTIWNGFKNDAVIRDAKNERANNRSLMVFAQENEEAALRKEWLGF